MQRRQRADGRLGTARPDEGDAAWAVVTHGVVGTLAVARGAAETLRGSWGDLDDESRLRLVDMVLDQVTHASGVLQDAGKGLSPEAVSALDRMHLRPL